MGMTAATILNRLEAHGHGCAYFEVNAAGELEHRGTLETHKLRPGESYEALITRLRAAGILRPGDKVEVPANGAIQHVRVIHPPEA